MEQKIKPINLPEIIINHFYVGVIITAFYIFLSGIIIENGYPGITVLLIAELVILAPIVGLHFYISARHKGVKVGDLIGYKKKMPWKRFLLWTILGIVSCILIYIPLYPLGMYLRTTLFSWLPHWYFNPSFGTDNLQLLANAFLFGIFIDGIVGPVCEEFFFRGYLLPRMAWLKNWAPIVNGALFGLYHFWQPHNFIATMAVGIILSYIVWKHKNVYLGIAIHVAINMMGSLGAYLGALDGIIVGR